MKHETVTTDGGSRGERKQAILEALRNEILTLRRSPGSVLDEVRLAGEYGVSRTPMREVLRDLAAQGYAALETNRGARVSDMSHETLRHFFLVAPMIYSAVLRLAALNAGPDQLAKLRDAQDDFRAALGEGDAARRTLANNRFHRITGDMAGSAYLLPSFERLLIDHARIGMTFYRPENGNVSGDLETACRQHDEIIDAIEAKDPDRASDLAIAHWNLSKNQIEKFVLPNGLDERLAAETRRDTQ